MKDMMMLKQLTEFRTQVIDKNGTYIASALIRKLRPGQMDRLLNISVPEEKGQDFHW